MVGMHTQKLSPFIEHNTLFSFVYAAIISLFLIAILAISLHALCARF
jgi:hypothetical protein